MHPTLEARIACHSDVYVPLTSGASPSCRREERGEGQLQQEAHGAPSRRVLVCAAVRRDGIVAGFSLLRLRLL